MVTVNSCGSSRGEARNPHGGRGVRTLGPVRLVALDMDGTLLTDDMDLTERTAACIRAAGERGVGFVLATGRPYCSARPYALRLGLDLPLVCYNGALVRDAASDTVRLSRPIPPAVAAEIAAFFRDAGLYCKVYAGDVLHVCEPTDETRYFTQVYGVPARAVGDLAAALSAGAVAAPSMMVVHAARPEAVPDLREELLRRWPGRIDAFRPNRHGLDIVSAGTSKGDALRRLAAGWGIPADAVLAVGNAGNDLDMLAWAGLGVAVANATEELLARADHVVADNNHEGVAEAIERFVLGAVFTDPARSV